MNLINTGLDIIGRPILLDPLVNTKYACWISTSEASTQIECVSIKLPTWSNTVREIKECNSQFPSYALSNNTTLSQLVLQKVLARVDNDIFIRWIEAALKRKQGLIKDSNYRATVIVYLKDRGANNIYAWEFNRCIPISYIPCVDLNGTASTLAFEEIQIQVTDFNRISLKDFALFSPGLI